MSECFLTPKGAADYYKAKYEDVCEKVLAWVKNMRDFDWCGGFQDSLDELARAAGGEPKDSDRPDYQPPRASSRPGPAYARELRS